MERLVKITRFAWTPHGVFGGLQTSGFSCYTLEPPDKGNQPFISCIPVGFYQIVRDTFKNKYPNFKILDVKDRTAIEIHIGNTADDTLGCPLVGRHYCINELESDYRITDSKDTMTAFMNAMFGIEQAWLVVV